MVDCFVDEDILWKLARALRSETREARETEKDREKEMQQNVVTPTWKKPSIHFHARYSILVVAIHVLVVVIDLSTVQPLLATVSQRK